jgi:putative hydrolase of the HAD superfamily
VKVVVFDVVGTLVEPWPRVSRAYAEVGRRHGVELLEEVIAGRFAAAWRRQEAIDAASTPAFATSRRREIERWRGIVDDVFEQAAASGAIFADLWEHFARPTAWRPLAEGVQLVEDVKRAGGEVALASNFDERLLAIARVVEPLTRADHVFASSELGWRKPAPEFFREVEQRLGRQPEELVLVGDDPLLDIAAARNAGWQAVSVAATAV